MTRVILAVAVVALTAGEGRAQARARAAREAAEWLIGRFGSKAGRSVPELAGRIERVALAHGDDAVRAIRKGGPAAVGLVEAAGADGAKALRVLGVHGELGASRVLSRPAAMKQFLRHGEEAATALVRHPGVAEPLIERGGAQAVKALGAVTPRNGRRVAMLLDGELDQAGRHPEVLGVIGKHGDGAVDFLWRHNGTLAGGAAFTAFLADPEPYLSGARDLAAAAGDGVVKPVVGGVTTLLTYALVLAGALLAGVVWLLHRHGPPSADAVRLGLTLFRK